MSLLKHLLLTVTLAIAAILIGTVWVSVDSARQYLGAQLQAQGDSAVSSLALSLSQPSNQDPVIQELLIAALFDTGQFKRIELFDVDEHSIVVREVSDERGGKLSQVAPKWFSEWLPISHSVAIGQVSNGWQQVGHVEIETDAASARDSLWASFIRVLLLGLAAGGAWALAVVVLMRWLRRALRDEIQTRVQGISGEGPAQASPTRSVVFKELAEVSQVIDAVRDRVQATAQEQTARLESLELALNRDDITGLANRRYFLNELRKCLQPAGADQAPKRGYVLLFRQRDLVAITKLMSRTHVDAWLRNVGDQVQTLLTQQGLPKAQLARLNGSDFVILLPEIEGPAIAPFSEALVKALAHLRVQLPNGEFCRWAIALTNYQCRDDFTEVLSRLDLALMRAESIGHGEVEFISRVEDSSEAALQATGETQWRELIQEGLAHQRFFLDTQLALSPLAQAPTYEATLMLASVHAERPDADGDLQSISAYLFMPIAVRLGLSALCDLRSIALAGQWLHEHPESSLILRVSLPSLLQPNFQEQLNRKLARYSGVWQRLYIELDAYGALAHPQELIDFVQATHPHGVRFGMRRVFEQPSVLALLDNLRLAYINVRVEALQSLYQTTGGRALMTALATTCQALTIQIRPDRPDSLLSEIKECLKI